MKMISESEWNEMAYAECKKLDEEYGTTERSPLHRSRRFPAQWAEELRFINKWYISCLGE